MYPLRYDDCSLAVLDSERWFKFETLEMQFFLDIFHLDLTAIAMPSRIYKQFCLR